MTLLRPHSWDVVELGLTPGSLVSVHTLDRYPILAFGVCSLGVGAGASAVDGRASRPGRAPCRGR